MLTARKVILEEIDRMQCIEADDLAIRLRLPEWGYWCRTHDHGLGYTKQITSQWSPKGWPEPELTARIPRIPDDQALEIDRAVASLDYPYKEAIERVYVNLEAYRALPRFWQRTRDVAIGKLSMVLKEA